MTTTALAPETESQCGHLSRTDIGKPDSGREVCDDCKQIFQDGVPVPTSVNSSPKSDQEALPKPTKASRKRVRAALKKHNPNGKAHGASAIGLNQEEGTRGKQHDDDVAKGKVLEDVTSKLDYVIGELKTYHTKVKAVEDADIDRATYHMKMRNDPKFYKAIMFLLDYFSNKPYNEIYVYNGTGYKSIKVLLLKEVGCTYEYLKKLTNKIGRFGKLLLSREEAEAKEKALKAKRDEKAAEKLAAKQQPNGSETNTNTQDSKPTIQQLDIASLSVDERVRQAINVVLPFMKFLSPREADDFVTKLYDTLQSEAHFDQPAIDIQYTVTEVTESATA